MHVGVAADHHLRRALAEHIERPPPRPFGHVAVRVRFELGTAEIDSRTTLLRSSDDIML
jgi:hypothetical protein